MTREILDNSFWTIQRQVVRNSYQITEHWSEIIKRFKNRIDDYYFTPLERIKDPNKLKGEGFSILTIQCALIEMFAAFKYGKIHKYNKNANDPNYTYRSADDCFTSFLHSETIFENHFYELQNGAKVLDRPFSASEFYNKVRCGLMHEARTKGVWIINAKKNYKGDETVFISVNTTNNKISIDRTILNRKLKEYFNHYLDSLSQDSVDGNNLRRLFARKLDHLYDIPSDVQNYDWWNDV
ncbi:MAG: hypothetical protein BGO53_02255 [Sphingobacteriales bacterium 39-19]|nr:hypothetical protein [Sphingobacteriales bacterium]OJW11189.1 MAG: hypothetical protein BGO53_02255 [Sphingobacteriales bacterium 39-19]